MSSHINLDITHHALKRWHERGDRKSIHEAVEDSTRVSQKEDLPESIKEYDANIRLYAPGEHSESLVFIVRDSTVVTVKPANCVRIDDSNLRECSVCGAAAEFAFSHGCNYCSSYMDVGK